MAPGLGFVTSLQSTSCVLINIGVADLPPLTFAGLRHILSFLCLARLILRASSLETPRELSCRKWLELASLGVLSCALTVATLFLALAYLPSMMVNLLWNLNTVTVALLGI